MVAVGVESVTDVISAPVLSDQRLFCVREGGKEIYWQKSKVTTKFLFSHFLVLSACNCFSVESRSWEMVDFPSVCLSWKLNYRKKCYRNVSLSWNNRVKFRAMSPSTGITAIIFTSKSGAGIAGRLRSRGSIPGSGKRFFSLQRPDRLRMKLTTHLHLVPRIRMVELYLHSPIYLHGVVLNYLSQEINVPFALPHSNRFRDPASAQRISGLKNYHSPPLGTRGGLPTLPCTAWACSYKNSRLYSTSRTHVTNTANAKASDLETSPPFPVLVTYVPSSVSVSFFYIVVGSRSSRSPRAFLTKIL
jgi:hypothetical protein